jgi:SanA protein
LQFSFAEAAGYFHAMKTLLKRKKIWYALLFIAIAALISIYYCNKRINDVASGKTYNDIASIPYHKVGLLLGTGKFLSNGHVNPYYQYRIDATIDLLKASKIKYLVISGDNGRKEYNEPETMRADLMLAGIDSTVIYLDYAGFRTFDSMVRLKEVFGQDDVTIISQQFHNQRAIYIASKEGINSIGFNAKDVSSHFGFRTQLREKLARVKVFVDYIIHTEPKFLGNRINIPA